MTTERTDRLQRHKLIRSLIRKVPYRAGNRIFSCVLANPVAFRLFAGSISALEKLKRELTGSSLTREDKLTFLKVNYISYWRYYALLKLSDAELFKRVRINGLEHLTNCHENKGVVLCNSHFGLGRLIPLLLARSGISLYSLDRVNTIDEELAGIDGRIKSIELGEKGNNFHLKQLMQMKKALKSNSILHMAVDGYRGESGGSYQFLGRQRPVRRSFAELAIMTGAAIVPVFSQLNADGSMEINLLSEIEWDRSLSNDRAVDEICNKYLGLLGEIWKKYPSNIHKNDVRVFNQLDRSDALELRFI